MPRRTTRTTSDVVQPVLPLVALMPASGPGRPPIGARIAAALAGLSLRPDPAAVEPVHRHLQRAGHRDIPITTARWLFEELRASHHPGRRRR
jgi:hypothetical protein